MVGRGAVVVLLLAAGAAGCVPAHRPVRPSRGKTFTVTAFAYNSTPAQTDGRPREAAFGHVLEPGMKVIAVSRDLEAAGLTAGTEVRIEGLPGTWTVLDRMHGRKTNAIDIYMGTDVAAARRWGKRTVTVSLVRKKKR